MAIKVIANWPWDDPKAMQQLRESQARATLIVLKKMFDDEGSGARGLDALMQKIENER
ncbi:hypothetical protein [Clostridium luticellarii]|uniref:Uncharacterized protein n=1 Tax=Clostridium luticellarii TaxID=1691940 RepID=A0A2T0BQ66_9CLOT|nr:hypothetical protein [Clostridium luticellarii]PRR86007.1 hypothetical protein CLLU_10350 [Clostridium luticellarii]